MKVLTKGHRYELENFQNKSASGQGRHRRSFSMNWSTHGATNEDVLAVLIDRLSSVNSKVPCRENFIALTHIETALLWLNKRKADRQAR